MPDNVFEVALVTVYDPLTFLLASFNAFWRAVRKLSESYDAQTICAIRAL